MLPCIFNSCSARSCIKTETIKQNKDALYWLIIQEAIFSALGNWSLVSTRNSRRLGDIFDRLSMLFTIPKETEFSNRVLHRKMTANYRPMKVGGGDLVNFVMTKLKSSDLVPPPPPQAINNERYLANQFINW